MSQNKTIIPGLRQTCSPTDGNQQTMADDPLAGIYKPSGRTNAYNSSNNGGTQVERTVIAGSSNLQTPAPASDTDTNAAESAHTANTAVPCDMTTIQLQERPLAGILFSLSRRIQGEIFPLYLGRNTVGSDKLCDIHLPESSVSFHHAVIVIRKIKSDGGQERMAVSVTDSGSSCGTFVNGEETGYDTHVIEDHDVLGFGISYRLALIKLHAAKLGLEPAPYFKETATLENRTNPESNPYKPENSMPNNMKTTIYE